MMKGVFLALIAAFVLGFVLCWVIAPEAWGYTTLIWIALGRPALMIRAVYLLGLAAGVGFLGLRVLKSGPL